MAYDNIPGFYTVLKDGGLVVERSGGATQSALVIAHASTGNDSDTQDVNPQWVSSQSQFIAAGFGSATKENPIFTAWKECVDAGCQDVRVLELKGSTAPVFYSNLHTIYKTLEDYDVDIVVVANVNADLSISSAPTFDETEVMDFCAEGAPEVVVSTKETPTGLVNGTNKAYSAAHAFIKEGTLKVYLTPDAGQEALVAETNYTVDYIGGKVTFGSAPTTGGSLKITYTYYNCTRDFAAQLAGYCQVVSSRVGQTLGVIAVAPAAGTTLAQIKSYVASFSTAKVYHGLLQLVAAPRGIFKDTTGTPYASNGTGAYAGLISVLPAQSSTTNKVLPGCYGLEYNLSPAQINTMCGKNLVTFRIKGGTVVVTDGVTTAGATSDFTRLSTMRITNDVIQGIRDVADPFIGEANDLPHRNALESAIKGHMQAMVQSGALSAYRITLRATLEQVISGNLYVDVEIVPASETRRITTTISLKPTLS